MKYFFRNNFFFITISMVLILLSLIFFSNKKIYNSQKLYFDGEFRDLYFKIQDQKLAISLKSL